MPTAQSYPFFETDFTKIFGEFRVPNFDVETILATQRRNIEAVTAANQLVIEGIQALLKREAEILRQTIEESSSVLKDLMGTGAPEEKLAQQTDLLKRSFEKAIANLRELVEMAAKSNTDATDVLTKRIGESLTELKAAVQKVKH
ncbi:MAG TPA: phasin family protein [Alphaproteobacteria bacterium]|nr:phasin family protein [Alphaproteobacteria bacterium]